MLPFSVLQAQLSVTSTATNFTIDFDATVANVNNGSFTGSGFANAPVAGELDADAWATSGMSDGAKAFGAANTGGDHARGTSTGGSGTGGIYGFDHGGGDMAVGWQPGGSDATPGSITLQIDNNTGVTITSLDVSYEVWEYNDQGRANDLRFSHDGTGNNGSGDLTNAEASLDFTSTETAAGSPSWVSVSRTITLTGLSIANGNSYFLRWATDDVSGSGSRDELAIDDIVVNANNAGCTLAAEPTTNASASSFSNVGCSTFDISWTDGDGAARLVVVSTAAIAGTPTDATAYTANAAYGSGSTIAANEYVVYNGSGSTVTVTGLAASTTYHIAIFEYNGTTTANCEENYLVTSPHTNSQATVACGYGLIINEIYVNTSVNDGSPNPDTGEWIEFYNEAGTPVDVSCWVFCDGDFCVTFPDGTIIAGHDYFLVGSATGVSCGGCDFPGQSMDLDWATSGCATGGTIGTFTNGAEQVVLFDETGAIVDAVEWGGGQALPTTMSTGAVCSCADQSVTLPTTAGGDYESLGSTTDATSFERQVDASSTWTTEGTPTIDATNGAALPVSLISLTAEKEGGSHRIKWTTASETNNYGFEVWRSHNGVHFEYIGFVDGAGTTTTTNSYSLLDFNPLEGENYYQLQQIDFNGERTKYPMLLLNSQSDVLSIDGWSINANQAEVKINGFEERTPINLEIRDISGKLIYQKFYAPATNLYLRDLNVAEGLFMIVVAQNGQKAVEKVKF